MAGHESEQESLFEQMPQPHHSDWMLLSALSASVSGQAIIGVDKIGIELLLHSYPFYHRCRKLINSTGCLLCTIIRLARLKVGVHNRQNEGTKWGPGPVS